MSHALRARRPRVAEASADNVVNNGLVVEGDELRLTAPDAVVTAYDRVQ